MANEIELLTSPTKKGTQLVSAIRAASPFSFKDGSMTLRRDILAKTEQVIEILKALPPDEVAVGWDESCVKTWLPFFEKIRDALLAPAPLPKEYNSLIIVRELDFSGLTAGRIFDLSVDIGAKLRELAASGE